MQMVGRNGGASDYRYGFQGQETDDEVTGSESHVAWTYRCHDARLGRFLSIDPLTSKYPHYSPYAFSGNRVIDATELEGLELNPLVWIAHGFNDFFAGVGDLFTFEAGTSVKVTQTVEVEEKISAAIKYKLNTMVSATVIKGTITTNFGGFFRSEGQEDMIIF
jgi:RHS repeat-associated protein